MIMSRVTIWCIWLHMINVIFQSKSQYSNFEEDDIDGTVECHVLLKLGLKSRKMHVNYKM